MINQKLASLEARIARLEGLRRKSSTNANLSVGDIITALMDDNRKTEEKFISPRRTNRQFFQIISLEGDVGVIRQLERIDQERGYDIIVKPNPNHFVGQPIKAKLVLSDIRGSVYLRDVITRPKFASWWEVWDGSPRQM